jgi:hypothetical protein
VSLPHLELNLMNPFLSVTSEESERLLVKKVVNDGERD